MVDYRLYLCWQAGGILCQLLLVFLLLLTSLNPTIGAGMVVGLVEAWLRKPKVYDFLDLKEDTCSLKGWLSNNVTRVLIVSFMAGLGSALGTYIAGYHIYGKLF